LLPSAGRCAGKIIPGSDAPKNIGGCNARRTIRGRMAGFARRENPSRGIMLGCENQLFCHPEKLLFRIWSIERLGLGVADPWFERAKESGPHLNGSLSIGENHEAIASRFRPGALSE